MPVAKSGEAQLMTLCLRLPNENIKPTSLRENLQDHGHAARVTICVSYSIFILLLAIGTHEEVY